MTAILMQKRLFPFQHLGVLQKIEFWDRNLEKEKIWNKQIFWSPDGLETKIFLGLALDHSAHS